MIGNNDKETSDLKCGLSWLEGKTKILIQQNEDGNCKRVSHCPVVVSTSKKRQCGFRLAWCHRAIIPVFFFRKKKDLLIPYQSRSSVCPCVCRCGCPCVCRCVCLCVCADVPIRGIIWVLPRDLQNFTSQRMHPGF